MTRPTCTHILAANPEHTTMTEHKKSLQALFVLQTFLISLMRDPVLTFYAHNTTHA